ncbi:glycosyltransferase family A protein [Neisseria canis]|uniref:LgtD n=1 Tax=Neisseria canis TaxID=493 RepID=A0A1X3CXP5_9NEIS|nr:glycosyltransferase family A protein [Neisseria canis]OSI12305.1 hypothetical protein BWD07_06300 [Neisseria canis]VEF00805.1 LgtD [Neisseria canis]
MNNSNHLPLVSVMIPYYNCQKYIIETIDSVEQQTYPNIEIIIVNDGSSEEDTLFLIDLLKNKSHIKYFYQENKGLSATRNAAATYAHGEYFLFLDADDVILPTYISQSVEILEKSPEVKLVYPLSEFFGAQTGIWQLPPYEGLKSILLGNRIPCIAIHRATHFRLSGGFDESLPTHEDWDLWIRMLAEGGEVFQIPEVLFRYRKRDDGSSLIHQLQCNPLLLKDHIQRVYIKNNTIFMQNQLSYWDLLQIFWQHQDMDLSLSQLQEEKNSFLNSNLNNKKLISDLIKQNEALDLGISQLQEEKANILNANSSNQKLISDLINQKQDLEKILASLESKNDVYTKSLVIKILKPLIKLEKSIKSGNRYRNLFRKLMKDEGGFREAWKTCQPIYQSEGTRGVKNFLKSRTYQQKSYYPLDLNNEIVILTTKHTYFIAKLFSQSLKKINISTKIIFEMPKKGYTKQWHIVICPQMFKKLPKHYLAFQMEQSISHRWFTKEYFYRLKNAEYIFDYSAQNIHFLQENDIPFNQLYYLPVGMLHTEMENNINQEFEYDVAFYGDPNCERRQLFLNKLREKFSVKVISEVFGDDLYALLKKARIIVNIHYYENALLETTRLYECLSLNKLIVSEVGSDQTQHPELENLVDFVEIGDVDSMIDKISYWLKTPTEFNNQLQKIQAESKKVSKFEFYFYRFLLAQDLINFDTFYNLCADYIQPNNDFWCLSLPESVLRRQDFERDNKYNIWIFPGLRHKIGWVGCGLSYKFMMKIAEKLNLPQVSICEDDVLFDSQFEQRYNHIKQDLTNSKEPWDIFSGLIADLSEKSEIYLSTVQSQTEKFYGINQLVSTVLNIYNQSAYSKIYSWDNLKHTTDNTIDRYIETHGGIKGLIVSPFLVSHKEELFSTLWGQQNTMYKDLINKSQNLLNQKISKVLVEEIKPFKK